MIGAEGLGDVQRSHRDRVDRIDSSSDRLAYGDIDAALEHRFRQKHIGAERQLTRADSDFRVGADEIGQVGNA